MEFGVQTRGPYEELLETVLWAESRGAGAFAVPDHYLTRGANSNPAWDALAHLAGLARETSTIRLAALVSPVTFRHPAVLYKMGVTLDEMSGGRFTLGLGAGWMDEEFEVYGLPYPSLKMRMEMYEEAMAYLRAAITPGSHGFDGKHYQLAEFDPHPIPIDLRLMGGGAGKPKARRIIALYADEYNLYARPPADYAEIRDLTRAEAEAAGRDPGSIVWTSASPALAAKKESDYRRILEAVANLSGQTTEHIEEVYEERQYPHGSGAKASEMVAALGEAGCELYYLQMFGADRADYDLILDAYEG